MLSLRRTPTPPIGLDVGSESIKLLQLCATGAGLKVSGAQRIRIPDDVKGDPDRRVAFAGDMLWPALRSGTFVGRRVVAAVPKELLHYKTHRLPPMAADEVCMAGRIDARDLFRFDPDSTDYQCIDAGQVRKDEDGRREVILIAAGRRYLDQFVNAIDGAGAHVESLDIDPCALWRVAGRFGDGDGEHPRVIIDIGAAQSRLLIGCAGQIRVIKTIDVGGDRLREAISRELGLSAAEVDRVRRLAATTRGDIAQGVRRNLADATRIQTERLAREVLASLRHHAATFRGPSAKRIELVGGEAGDAHIRSTLALTLLLPVRPANPFRGIDTAAIPGADRTEHLGEWAVALGLAMKGMPAEAEALSPYSGRGLGEGLDSASKVRPSPQPSPGAPGDGESALHTGVRP